MPVATVQESAQNIGSGLSSEGIVGLLTVGVGSIVGGMFGDDFAGALPMNMASSTSRVAVGVIAIFSVVLASMAGAKVGLGGRSLVLIQLLLGGIAFGSLALYGLEQSGVASATVSRATISRTGSRGSAIPDDTGVRDVGHDPAVDDSGFR